MDKNDLEIRTKALAVGVIELVGAADRSLAWSVVGRQLMRAATSVGANCREAGRAESRRDFIHQIALAEKECAETQYWLDIFAAIQCGDAGHLARLSEETAEILAILVSIGRKAKSAPARPRR